MGNLFRILTVACLFVTGVAQGPYASAASEDSFDDAVLDPFRVTLSQRISTAFEEKTPLILEDLLEKVDPEIKSLTQQAMQLQENNDFKELANVLDSLRNLADSPSGNHGAARMYILLFSPDAILEKHDLDLGSTVNFLSATILVPDEVISKDMKKQALRHMYMLQAKLGVKSGTMPGMLLAMFRYAEEARVDKNWVLFDAIDEAYAWLLEYWIQNNITKDPDEIKKEFFCIALDFLFERAEKEGKSSQKYAMALFTKLRGQGNRQGYRQVLLDFTYARYNMEGVTAETMLNFLAREKFIRTLPNQSASMSYDGAVSLYSFLRIEHFIAVNLSASEDTQTAKVSFYKQKIDDLILEFSKAQSPACIAAALNMGTQNCVSALNFLSQELSKNEEGKKEIEESCVYLFRMLRNTVRLWTPAFNQFESCAAVAVFCNIYAAKYLAGDQDEILSEGIPFLIEHFKAGNKKAEESIATILSANDTENGAQFKLCMLLHKAWIL